MSDLIPGPVVLFNDNTVVSSDMIVGPTSITQVSKGIAVRFTAGGAVAEEPGAVIPTQTWIG